MRSLLDIHRAIHKTSVINRPYTLHRSSLFAIGQHIRWLSGQVIEEFNNNGIEPLRVPGFGQSIDFDPFEWPNHCFRHGCSDHYSFQRLTVREIAMLRMMNTITDKAGWEQKVFDTKITQKWKIEALEKPDSMINDDIFAWVLAELQDKASEYESTKFIKALDTESRVVKSDTLIKSDLHDQLLAEVTPLLQRSKKDWHPNSNEQVLNLVHPSLFPLVYGRTRVLRDGQLRLQDSFSSNLTSETVPGGQEVNATRSGTGYISTINNTGLWSTHFQWLPSEVEFLGDIGTNVHIKSYINNLHPLKHQPLYAVIEKLISKSLPLWNSVLFRGHCGRTSRRITTNKAVFVPPQPLEEWPNEWDEAGSPKNLEWITRLEEYWAQPEDPNFVEQNPDDSCSHPPKDLKSIIGDLPDRWQTRWSPWDLAHYKWYRIRKVVHPMPEQSYETWKGKHSNDKEHIQLEKEFRDRGLQVIVKLASIELTPEKPKYEGGSWHLEGMQNEHIVATSIYYFDVKNTTTAHLRFRQFADLDNTCMEYEQDDHEPLAEIFGTESLRDEPALQEIGSVATPEGRIISFPNTLQHCAEPFELEDKTKPGHRRFLVLWLVDPHFRIISTANVPPQQADWWERSLSGENVKKATGIQTLMTIEEAKDYRAELMKERTTFAETIENNTDTYNFCEH